MFAPKFHPRIQNVHNLHGIAFLTMYNTYVMLVVTVKYMPHLHPIFRDNIQKDTSTTTHFVISKIFEVEMCTTFVADLYNGSRANINMLIDSLCTIY